MRAKRGIFNSVGEGQAVKAYLLGQYCSHSIDIQEDKFKLGNIIA